MRRCACGRELPPRRRTCDLCKRVREQRRELERVGRRLSPEQRGYGVAHRAERRKWVAIIAVGGAPCARCGELIQPGERFDLGHVDGDKSRYAGPEHVRCNRATAGRRAPWPTSRSW